MRRCWKTLRPDTTPGTERDGLLGAALIEMANVKSGGVEKSWPAIGRLDYPPRSTTIAGTFNSSFGAQDEPI
jgi:hypothetical protein